MYNGSSNLYMLTVFAALVLPSIIGTVVYYCFLNKRTGETGRAALLFFVSSILLFNTILIYIISLLKKDLLSGVFTGDTTLYFTLINIIINVIIALKIGKEHVILSTYRLGNTERVSGSIEFWRIVFSLVILLFHGHSFISDAIPFRHGRFAVEFFFVVTGFLLAKSADNYIRTGGTWDGAGVFLFNRWKRFYPETIISVCISFMIIHLRTQNLVVKKNILDLIKSIFQILLVWMSGLNLFPADNVTWYISVVFIASAVLFLVMLINKKVFFDILAPLIATFCLGSLCIKYGKLVGYSDDLIFSMYRGIVRGIGEMSLGCFCFSIYDRIRKLNFTKFGRNILTLVELLGYLFTIYWIFDHNPENMDFALVLLVSISIIISFSGKSSISSYFQKDGIIWLGRFSFPLYLGHTYWAQSLNKFFPQMDSSIVIILYIVLSLMTAMTIMTVSQTMRDLHVVDRIIKKMVM